jgi:hypothetical protein
MAVAFLFVRLLDGFPNTRDNYRGTLPAIFERNGLRNAAQTRRLRTPLGTIALYPSATLMRHARCASAYAET